MKKTHASNPRWTPTDKRFMELAFAEARKVKGKTLPNPPVGAVLAKRGLVEGKGGTRPAGQSHAEIVALDKAGEKAEGSTLYVTLEPCGHHGRTPPCVDAIIKAGIRKVVIAIQDANPLVGGQGIRALRDAGIEVAVGLMEEEAALFYEGFFYRITHGRPLILLKIAQSLDGRINSRPGVETAITGEASRKWTHGLRSLADAVVITGRTLRADDPDLTPRLVQGPAPEVVVLSRRGPFPAEAKIFSKDRNAKTLVLGESGAGLPAWVEHVAAEGAPSASDPLASLLALFDKRGYHSVLIEGGRELWTLFLQSGKWDKLYVLTAPQIFPEGDRWDTGLARDWGKSLKFRNLTPFGSDFLTEFGHCEPEE
ncbi:MAG: riboflavin biosynthesis protein RibD [Fibrobacteres bacterium]|nr:riboflavin biosynthesis protein RibD [Fibrobacterota bacterium]